MRFVVALALVVSLPSVPAARPSEMSFSLSSSGSIVVDVMLNGTGPFRFLLDTGSSRSAITQQAAERLRLQPAGRSEVLTPTGRATRPIAVVGTVELGGRTAANVRVLLLPAGDHGARHGVDGLLGQDVLAREVYTIDYERKVVAWGNEAAQPSLAVPIPLDVTETGVVALLQQRPSKILRLIPDSGADCLVLFHDRTVVAMTPLEPVLLRSVSGQRIVRRALVEDLRVGGLLLRSQDAVIVPRGSAAPALADGLLPLHLFARVTFDGPARQLIVAGRR